ncbi:MAG: hypothetical protein H6Q68_54 [Firmicutes bacterium]|nr:hypothetical protein [Bacillota bacterium]
MYSKVEKNYFINIMLAIIGFACMFTGVALAFKPAFLMTILSTIKFKSLHEWTGYVLIILIGWHILMHSEWIKSVTEKIVNDKKKLVAAVLTILLSVGICITISTLSPEMKAPNGKGGYPGQVGKSN